jgi:galactose dehydrogenase
MRNPTDADDLPEGISEHVYVSYPDLAGGSVFITGGGSGIGAYFVDAFARQGAQVGFVSLTSRGSERLCAAVERRTGRRPFHRAVDVRDIRALQGALADFVAAAGVPSVLINNAARDDRHSVAELTVERWDDSLNTNLRPYFFTARQLAPEMAAAGGGVIINIGSNSANLGLAGYPVYVTAKAAITGLTRALARELGPQAIRVNALIPGWVMTARQKALWVTPEKLQECLDQQSLKSTISGEHIAEAALFLASRAAAMITGQSLIVDGGRFMQ